MTESVQLRSEGRIDNITTSIDSVTGLASADKSTGQAKHVTQKDANDNTIGGAFAPGAGADLTAGAAVATQTLAAGTSYVHFDVATTAVRILFGIAGATALTATTGTRIQAGASKTFQVPTGADRFQYIRDGAADGSINWTPS